VPDLRAARSCPIVRGENRTPISDDNTVRGVDEVQGAERNLGRRQAGGHHRPLVAAFVAPVAVPVPLVAATVPLVAALVPLAAAPFRWRPPAFRWWSRWRRRLGDIERPCSHMAYTIVGVGDTASRSQQARVTAVPDATGEAPATP